MAYKSVCAVETKDILPGTLMGTHHETSYGKEYQVVYRINMEGKKIDDKKYTYDTESFDKYFIEVTQYDFYDTYIKLSLMDKIKKIVQGSNYKHGTTYDNVKFDIKEELLNIINYKIIFYTKKIRKYKEISLEFNHIIKYTLEMLSELYGKITDEEYYCEIDKAHEVIMEIYKLCIESEENTKLLISQTIDSTVPTILEKHHSIMESNLLALRDLNGAKLLK